MTQELLLGPDALAAVGKWHVQTTKADKGGTAALRRVTLPAEAAFEPAYHNLLRRLKKTEVDITAEEKRHLAVFVALSAHIDLGANGEKPTDNGRNSIATDLGTPERSSKRAKMSDLRFKRILQAETPEDAMTELRRAIVILKGKANLFDLYRSVMGWNEKTRMRWAEEYYAKAPPEGKE